MKGYLKNFDIISPNPAHRIHFGVDAHHKTVVGGICSILAITGLLIVACI